MKSVGRLLRLAHIARVLVQQGLDEVVFAIPPLRPVAFVFYLLPWNWVRRPKAPRGVRIRRALETLGPIFVKFGQTLSTRRDLLPSDVADELAGLQDNVPPFPGREARRLVETSLRATIDELFSEFDEVPLASASIAQVHAARLRDGRKVVVKVVRPDIEAVIRRDVDLLHIVADLAARYWREARRLKPREVVAEYEAIIIDELDLMREAASAAQLRRNFEGSDLLYVPEVDWTRTRRDVMVMERVSGIPISDVAALRAAGVDLRKLAERGVEIFFTQVVRHNFFHADMHPGNIFVASDSPGDPCYIAVDFGIMGSLTAEDKRYLAENFVAFFNRDYRRVAELHVESQWVPSDTRVEALEAAIRTVCEPIFQRPLREISFGHLLLRLFETARRFDMQVQPQLVLLQKTLLNIEGLGRQLYPDLDLWATAKPFLERWMSEQLGGKALMREVRRQAPQWGESLPRLPSLAYEVLRLARDGRLEVRMQSDDLHRIRAELRAANRRTVQAVVGAALILGASAIFGLDGYQPATWGGIPVASWLLGALGFGLVLAAWPPDGEP